MARKPESEKNTEYDHTCRANFYTIRKRLGLGQEAFYKHYIKPLSPAYEVIDGKQFVDTLERGTRVLNCEILKMYSDLANVSINELMTTDLQEEHAPNLRNAFNALFTVLESLPIKVSKNTEHGIDVFTMTTSLSDEFEGTLSLYILNLFLEEYTKHKDLDKAAYLEWKQSLLRKSFNHDLNGRPTTGKSNKPMQELLAKALVSSTDHLYVIALELLNNQEWLREHSYLNRTKEEWDSLDVEYQINEIEFRLVQESQERLLGMNFQEVADWIAQVSTEKDGGNST